MKPVLRRIHSPDVDDLRTYVPPSRAFAVLVQLLVGPSTGSGEESFDLLVCSPSWLALQPGPIMGCHHLILQEYDYQLLSRFIIEYLEQCEADDWRGVAAKVGRLGRWEYEDYRP